MDQPKLVKEILQGVMPKEPKREYPKGKPPVKSFKHPEVLGLEVCVWQKKTGELFHETHRRRLVKNEPKTFRNLYPEEKAAAEPLIAEAIAFIRTLTAAGGNSPTFAPQEPKPEGEAEPISDRIF